jgi:hypothetical protein
MHSCFDFPSSPGRKLHRFLCPAFAWLVLLSAPVLRAQDGTPGVLPAAPTVGPAPIVDQPLPPAVSQEVPEPQPSSRHVWVAGHWRWQGGNYAWIAPHWEIPPVANSTWVPPRWEKKTNGYVLIEGYWEPSSAPSTVATPATPPPPVAVVITVAPPPPQREIIVERPSTAHVWIGGYWAWRDRRHVWIPGHWELPPRARVVWVEPRWERRGNAYVLVEGYWQEVGPSREYGPPPSGGPIVIRRPTEIVVMRDPPPPLRREVMGPRPSPRHLWISGYWALRAGRHVWVEGRWEIPPRGYSVWEEPRWERRNGGYVFIEGRWR